jgi:pyruvate/2-oxoglutarate dehydrogenase complex dihydrolipoamide dehydrogenase (E3) component
MIAQATADGISFWGSLGALITIIFVQVGKILSDARKDKRDLLNDTIKRDALLSIRDSNERSVIAQTEVKMTLEKSHEIDKIRHDTLLAAINQLGLNCKQITSNQNK